MTDLTMIRGDDWTFVATLVDEAGDPFDLTGAEVTFTVGCDFSKTIGAGVTVAFPATGVATIDIEPADTEDLPRVRSAREYAVRLELADGSIHTPLRGLFIVLPVPLPV